MSVSTAPVQTQNHALTEEQVAGYWEKGWIVLPGLFSSAEAAGWQAECDRLITADFVHEHNLRTGFRPIEGVKTIERIDPVIDVSDLFKSTVEDPRITSAVGSLLGDQANLFKDKLIFKVPGMTGYSVHQDQAWWQMCDADDILSVLISIDAATKENGCLELFPGYHRSLLTPKGELRNLNEAEVPVLIDASIGEIIETKPGDVVIFHSLTPHKSAKNLSQTSRRSLYLTYCANRSGNLYAAHRDHYRTYITAAVKEEERALKFFK